MVKTITRLIDKWSDFLSPLIPRFPSSFLCFARFSFPPVDFLHEKYDCLKQSFDFSCR